MYLLIDNYDSFTYNLLHFMGEIGAECVVRRNDAVAVDEALGLGARAIVLSPGPCDPDRAGICLDLIKAAPADLPILGVCLGHQSIGQAYGGTVVRGPAPVHGKLGRVHHEGDSVFAGLPSPFSATRYHSLVIDPATMPDVLLPTARTEDGVIMGVRHRDRPVHGVQFHPESIATAHGHQILANFMALCGDNPRPIPEASNVAA